MKAPYFLFSLLMLTDAASPAFSQIRRAITLSKADGGSVVTELSRTIKVNDGSSLHRRWFVLNDESCPVKLGSVGVLAKYRPSEYTGSYEFLSNGPVTAAQDIQAVRLVFVIFDIFGNKMKSLSAIYVKDLAAQALIPHDGTWYASENDVEEFFTSVVFVSDVMLKDGKIWRSDYKTISSKLAEVEIKISEAGLEPDAPKPDPKGK